MLIQPSTPVVPAGRPEPRPRDVLREAPVAQAMPSDTPADATAEVSDSQVLKAAVAASNRVVQSLQSKIEFVTDDSSGQMLIKVIDSASNELIRQIPSEEMLAISRALDRMQGLLLNSEA
jgi:flagellar protein FlaG